MGDRQRDFSVRAAILDENPLADVIVFVVLRPVFGCLAAHV